MSLSQLPDVESLQLLDVLVQRDDLEESIVKSQTDDSTLGIDDPDDSSL